MTGLDWTAKLVQFVFSFAQCCQNATGDLAKVVVLQLLVARGHSSNERATCNLQIWTTVIYFTINQEELLFGAES